MQQLAWAEFHVAASRVVPSGGRPSNAQSQPAARAVVPSERPRSLRADHGSIGVLALG
jgi:hypothetical protein